MNLLKYYLAYSTFLLSLPFLLPSVSLSSQEGDKASTSVQDEAQAAIVVHQLEVASKLGTVNKDFDMEESGIVGLGDRAGLSIGLKYYLELVEQYKEKLQKDPKNVTFWLGLANTWEALKKDDNALGAYQQVLDISENNATAQQGITRIQKRRQLQLRIYWSFVTEDEYSPLLRQDYISWQEQVRQIQVTKSWGEGKTIGIGWLDSSIQQDNLIYGDVDFSLHRQAPFFMLSWPLMDRVATSIRIRDEKFSNDDDNAFYQLDENKHIITGHFLINYKGDGFWTAINYSRNRETDPIYDTFNERALLYVEVKELTGVSAGVALAPRLEIGSSIYYEQYNSINLDQINANLQISYWPSWLSGFQVNLGSGYYTEEKETIVNLTTRYQWQPWQQLQIQLEYQLEYSENEDSWLNQGDLLLNWPITEQLSMTLRTQYGAETGGDKDTIFFTQTSFNWNFF